jgi:hypothetical protein
LDITEQHPAGEAGSVSFKRFKKNIYNGLTFW